MLLCECPTETTSIMYKNSLCRKNEGHFILPNSSQSDSESILSPTSRRWTRNGHAPNRGVAIFFQQNLFSPLLIVENIHKHIARSMWPPGSPDLTPPNFYVWDVIVMESKKPFHSIKVSLKSTLVDVIVNINEKHIINAFSRLPS